MTVADVFAIPGSGTVATGCVATGVVRQGDRLVIRKADGNAIDAVCEAIEKSRRVVTQASEGEEVGLLLTSISGGEVETGDTIASSRP